MFGNQEWLERVVLGDFILVYLREKVIVTGKLVFSSTVSITVNDFLR